MEEVWRRFKLTGDPAARDEIIKANVHLVKYVLGRLLCLTRMSHETLDFDDLYSVGVMGLIRAVDSFDITRDVKFVTYAIPRIRGSIVDELRIHDPLPRTMRAEVQRLEKIITRLEMDKQRPANDAELCSEMGISQDRLDEIVSAMQYSIHVSLDEEVSLGEEGVATKRDLLKDETGKSPRSGLLRNDLVESLADAIDALPEKERHIVILYYMEELTFREIGEVIGVTESRVCQLHTKAMSRLRGKLKNVELDLAS